MPRYIVSYNVKDLNRNSATHGYLLEKRVEFPSLKEAHEYSRRILNQQNIEYKLLGIPTIERK